MLVDLVDTAELHGAVAASVNQRPWLEQEDRPASKHAAEPGARRWSHLRALPRPWRSPHRPAARLLPQTSSSSTSARRLAWFSPVNMVRRFGSTKISTFANPRIPRELRESGYWPGSLTGFRTRMRHYPAGDHSLVRQRWAKAGLAPAGARAGRGGSAFLAGYAARPATPRPALARDERPFRLVAEDLAQRGQTEALGDDLDVIGGHERQVRNAAGARGARISERRRADSWRRGGELMSGSRASHQPLVLGRHAGQAAAGGAGPGCRSPSSPPPDADHVAPEREGEQRGVGEAEAAEADEGSVLGEGSPARTWRRPAQSRS